ncbi:hypothetical protein MUN77_00055 [Leucobacter allii]|uniref:acyltransferase family protein n=1 Tax=Leucobacter allii TaxID=2932247 RepID=UPI001FD23B5F|nr:acyltransferase family protein [Leucobacter allii]UOR01758.1 hypothetical protein MUN77_00055 [Leucobacter allii]
MPELPQPLAGARPRIAFWDNARFALIVLVVVGHAISTVRTESALGFAIYAYIYLFHMPAMILLSGIFSRAEASPKVIRSTLQLVVTWLIWEGIWAAVDFAVLEETPDDDFLETPAWTLWFLISLATMRILLPYLARLRHPLLVSIALALAAGAIPDIGTAFSAHRTLVFLPFFVTGWLIRERGWLDGQWFARPFRGARVAAWTVLGGIALAFALLPGLRETWRIDTWLTWRDDYDWLFRNAPIGEWLPSHWLTVLLGGAAVSAALLVVAAAMTLSLLIVVPRSSGPATVWGTRTLYVYLLHGPVVWVLRETGVIDAVGGAAPPGSCSSRPAAPCSPWSCRSPGRRRRSGR